MYTRIPLPVTARYMVYVQQDLEAFDEFYPWDAADFDIHVYFALRQPLVDELEEIHQIPVGYRR